MTTTVRRRRILAADASVHGSELQKSHGSTPHFTVLSADKLGFHFPIATTIFSPGHAYAHVSEKDGWRHRRIFGHQW